MASTITGSSSFSNTHTVPDDGDNLTAASAITPWQSLADNTRYLQQLTESSGVKLVRSVSNVSAMEALTGMADREICWVEGLGLYFYDSGSAVSANSITIVQPSSGGGRWFHASYAIRGSSYGVASLDSGGKLIERPGYRHLVDAEGGLLTGGTFSPSPGYYGAIAPTLVGKIASGDRVILTASTTGALSGVPTGNNNVLLQYSIDGGATKLPVSPTVNPHSTTPQLLPYIGGTVMFTAAGTITDIRLYVAYTSTSGETLYTDDAQWQLSLFRGT